MFFVHDIVHTVCGWEIVWVRDSHLDKEEVVSLDLELQKKLQHVC